MWSSIIRVKWLTHIFVTVIMCILYVYMCVVDLQSAFVKRTAESEAIFSRGSKQYQGLYEYGVMHQSMPSIPRSDYISFLLLAQVLAGMSAVCAYVSQNSWVDCSSVCSHWSRLVQARASVWPLHLQWSHFHGQTSFYGSYVWCDLCKSKLSQNQPCLS